MQDKLIAGDTLNYPVSVRGRPSSEGWTLKFRLVPRGASGAAVEITAAPYNGDDYVVRALAPITSLWVPGLYGYAAWVENVLGETYTVETGQLEVLPNPRTSAVATDTRSLPRRTLDGLIAARSEWALSNGRTRRYKIADREREFASAAELDQEIRFWESQLAAEESATRLAAGLRSKNRILTRFTRPR